MSGQNGKGSYYIPCRVEPGMFREEWLVVVDAADPKNPQQSIQAQMFVDQRDVQRLEGTPARGQPTRGWLRVQRAGTQEGMAVIVLPQWAQPVGTTILVRDNLVEEDKS